MVLSNVKNVWIDFSLFCFRTTGYSWHFLKKILFFFSIFLTQKLDIKYQSGFYIEVYKIYCYYIYSCIKCVKIFLSYFLTKLRLLKKIFFSIFLMQKLDIKYELDFYIKVYKIYCYCIYLCIKRVKIFFLFLIVDFNHFASSKRWID